MMAMVMRGSFYWQRICTYWTYEVRDQFTSPRECVFGFHDLRTALEFDVCQMRILIAIYATCRLTQEFRVVSSISRPLEGESVVDSLMRKTREIWSKMQDYEAWIRRQTYA